MRSNWQLWQWLELKITLTELQFWLHFHYLNFKIPSEKRFSSQYCSTIFEKNNGSSTIFEKPRIIKIKFIMLESPLIEKLS